VSRWRRISSAAALRGIREGHILVHPELVTDILAAPVDSPAELFRRAAIVVHVSL
jgi:hypothetical protein